MTNESSLNFKNKQKIYTNIEYITPKKDPFTLKDSFSLNLNLMIKDELYVL